MNRIENAYGNYPIKKYYKIFIFYEYKLMICYKK